MKKIYSNITELIGKTPLLFLSRFGQEAGSGAEIIAKLEYLNPTGSVKDRIAHAMIKEALFCGKIRKDTVIIEPTSGNTGIGLACVAASLGLKLILTMPESMSVERRKMLAAYGAQIVLTDAKLGMNGAISKAEEIAKNEKNSFIPSQFSNPENPKTHYLTTGPELYEDTDGEIDIFVAGIGSGGTISGTAKYLKEKNPDIKIVGVEPSDSPLISKGYAGAHKIQGLGAGFIPENLNLKIIDKVVAIEFEDAIKYARLAAKTEGLLCGISSGAVLCAAALLGKEKANYGKKIAVLLPDSADRYYSTPLFE